MAFFLTACFLFAHGAHVVRADAMANDVAAVDTVTARRSLSKMVVSETSAPDYNPKSKYDLSVVLCILFFEPMSFVPRIIYTFSLSSHKLGIVTGTNGEPILPLPPRSTWNYIGAVLLWSTYAGTFASYGYLARYLFSKKKWKRGLLAVGALIVRIAEIGITEILYYAKPNWAPTKATWMMFLLDMFLQLLSVSVSMVSMTLAITYLHMALVTTLWTYMLTYLGLEGAYRKLNTVIKTCKNILSKGWGYIGIPTLWRKVKGFFKYMKSFFFDTNWRYYLDYVKKFFTLDYWTKFLGFGE